MASRTWLSDQQKRRAAEIAREKGLSCPDCGSSEPVPTNEVQFRTGGGAEIAMCCEDCESASETTLILSPEEARALGLGDALRERPEETS